MISARDCSLTLPWIRTYYAIYYSCFNFVCISCRCFPRCTASCLRLELLCEFLAPEHLRCRERAGRPSVWVCSVLEEGVNNLVVSFEYRPGKGTLSTVVCPVRIRAAREQPTGQCSMARVRREHQEGVPWHGIDIRAAFLGGGLISARTFIVREIDGQPGVESLQKDFISGARSVEHAVRELDGLGGEALRRPCGGSCLCVCLCVCRVSLRSRWVCPRGGPCSPHHVSCWRVCSMIEADRRRGEGACLNCVAPPV